MQELARGIHPAVLAQGGLRTALKTLARRAAIPVHLDLGAVERLPDHVEISAYDGVAETLCGRPNASAAAAAAVAKAPAAAPVAESAVEAVVEAEAKPKRRTRKKATAES